MREGRETYAYLTLDELITTFAINSAQAAHERRTVLLPTRSEDILVRQRNYYNRYLGKHLANPLEDAKQLVLFSHIDVEDSETLGEALSVIGDACGKHNLARVYSAINRRG